MAIDNRLQVFNEEGQSVDYDILASDVKFLPDGKDLPTKLAEMEAHQGDGTVTGVKVGSNTYEPTEGVVDISPAIPDVSGKANKSEMSVVPGTGANADKTTITLKEGTNATVLTQHQDISGKVDKDPNKELIPSTDLAKLQNLPTADELTQQMGAKANDSAVVKSISVNGTAQSKDSSGNVNIQVQAGEQVVINSDGANIVDGQSDSILTAPSSRMVKEIYLNLQKLFDPVNGLANIAFVGTRPTWQSVAIPTHTITLGTMTNVDASLNGTAISGSTSATEGEVTILLAPTSNNYMGSISVKDASNNDVAFTQTDVAGGTEITFILSGNVTISASASSGIEVNVSGTGITSYTTGVQPNTAAQLTIALPEHHTWGTVTVSYGGTDITSQCTISQANNADKVITLPNNLSDMSKSISIVANTVEDSHVTIAISGSNFVVKQGNTQLSNGSKVYNGSAAQTLTIEPASGYKFSTLPSADKGTMTNNGPYEASSLEIGTSVSGTLTITAAGSALQTFSIDLSGVTSDVGVTWNTPSAAVSTILEGSPFSVTLAKVSGTGVLNISTSTMGSETLTPNNGTISTDHVTGDITIAASVAAARMKVHSYNSKDVDANNKNYMVDSVGEFPLYLQADAGYSTNNYPAGYYANGINDGYRVGYGSNRTLNIEQGGDFTVVIKNIVMYVNANNIGYNNQQFLVRFYDRIGINVGTQNREGQFQLTMSSQDDNSSGFSGNMYPHIAYYSSSGIVKKIFKDDGAVGSIPGARSKISDTDTYTNTYHIAVSYNASTKIATAYVIDIDNVNNNVSVKLSGALTIDCGIIMPCIATQKYLDVFNYVLSQQDLESEYSVN